VNGFKFEIITISVNEIIRNHDHNLNLKAKRSFMTCSRRKIERD